RLAVLGGVEHLAEVLLGLADPLRGDARQVDPVEVEAELARDEAGDHGLAGAGRAVEQRHQAARGRYLVLEAPALVDGAPVLEPSDELADAVEHVVRQRDLLPAGQPLDVARHLVEPHVDVLAGGAVELGGDVRLPRALAGAARRDVGDDLLDGARADAEARGELGGAAGLEPAAEQRRAPELEPLPLAERRQGEVEEARVERWAQLRADAEADRPRVGAQDVAHGLDPLAVLAVEELEVEDARQRAAQERQAQLRLEGGGEHAAARQVLAVYERERLAVPGGQRR